MSVPGCTLTWRGILNSVRRFLVTTNVTTAMATTDGCAYQTTATTESDPRVDAAYCEWCRRNGHSASNCRNGQLAPSYATPGGPLTARLIFSTGLTTFATTARTIPAAAIAPTARIATAAAPARLPGTLLMLPRRPPQFPPATLSLARSPLCPQTTAPLSTSTSLIPSSTSTTSASTHGPLPLPRNCLRLRYLQYHFPAITSRFTTLRGKALNAYLHAPQAYDP